MLLLLIVEHWIWITSFNFYLLLDEVEWLSAVRSHRTAIIDNDNNKDSPTDISFPLFNKKI